MTLKQINTIRAQHRWLDTHPAMLKTLRLSFCPSHPTLARRYKALCPLLTEFCEFISEWAVANGYGFSHTLAYEDKSLFKAQGPVWHKKHRAQNHIPKGLRNVDKTAHWSKSGYHGWVYGYGLHLTTTRDRFPVMFEVLPANVNERKVLDKKQSRIIAKGITCLIADAGYRDKRRTAAFAKAKAMLITPISALNRHKRFWDLWMPWQLLYSTRRKRPGKHPLNRLLIYLANSWQRRGSINLYPSAVWLTYLLF